MSSPRLLFPVPEGEVNCDSRASQQEYLKNVYLATLKIRFGILKVSRFSISVFIYSTEVSQDEIQAFIRTMIFDLKQQHLLPAPPFVGSFVPLAIVAQTGEVLVAVRRVTFKIANIPRNTNKVKSTWVLFTVLIMHNNYFNVNICIWQTMKLLFYCNISGYLMQLWSIE